MLSETEQELLDIIDGDSIKAKLKLVDVLPFQTAEQLMRYTFQAPAVYLNFNQSPVVGVTATSRYTLLCVSRNARGFKEATYGDSTAIGAYPLADRLAAIISHGSAGFTVTGIRPMRDSLFDKQGLTVVGVDVETNRTLDDPLDPSTLEPFITYHADHLHSDDPDVPISQDEVTLEQP